MSRRTDRRRAGALALAEELSRLADYHRLLDRALSRTHELYIDAPIDLGRPDLDAALDRAQAYNLNLDRFRTSLEREQGIVRDIVFIDDLANALDQAATTLRRRNADASVDRSWKPWDEGRLLGLLARFLPADERTRFVAEALGNVGDCDHWWQRIDHLVCLAIGMPRLAWIVRREGRRGRV